MSVPPSSTTPSEPPAEASAAPQARPRGESNPPSGFIFQVALVVGAALLLATLFTAWTPGRANPSLRELFGPQPTTVGGPGAQATSLALALLPSPTFPPGAPTPTLANPNLVGIVAGHWKNDSGAVCADGLTEVAINLEIASRVQKQLVDAGYQVDLLSEFDPRLNGYQAAALVSIHNDSCQFVNDEATGFKVASAMATHHPEQAAHLTSCLRARYGSATQLPLHSTSVTLDMTSYHAFGEIHDSTPAAIIETGFLNRDREILTQRPDVVAFGVASGILCYLENELISTPTSVPPTAAAPAVPPTDAGTGGLPASTGVPGLNPALPGVYPAPTGTNP